MEDLETIATTIGVLYQGRLRGEFSPAGLLEWAAKRLWRVPTELLEREEDALTQFPTIEGCDGATMVVSSNARPGWVAAEVTLELAYAALLACAEEESGP
jgi:hypothetical protein